MNKRLKYLWRKKVVCLDFDGVIHKHLAGWKDRKTIKVGPVKGAAEAIKALREK